MFKITLATAALFSLDIRRALRESVSILLLSVVLPVLNA